MWEKKVGCGWNHSGRHTKRQMDSRQTYMLTHSSMDQQTDRHLPPTPPISPNRWMTRLTDVPQHLPNPHTDGWSDRQADRQVDR